MTEGLTRFTLPNTNFAHLIAMNTSYTGPDYYFCPLSKLNDGYMDVVLSRMENSGHIRLAKVLID